MNPSINYSPDQLKWLRNQGIVPHEALDSGTVPCTTSRGERYYTASDLAQLAKPGFMDRFTAWMNQGVAS
jgi:hypothetical protein